MAILSRSVLLVSNPASRRGAALHDRTIVAFRDAGVGCDAIVTERAGHGAEIVAAIASRYDAVFTLGGDGTATEVISALVGTGIPVGILRGGTGNQLARYFRIPGDVRSAVRALLDGTPRRVDLGRLADGRRFAYTAGIGADATMVAGTPPLLKRTVGVAAYAIAATRTVLRAQSFDVRVVVDRRVIERRAIWAMIANAGTLLSGMFAFGPDIRPDDGMLDLCLFSPSGPLDAVRLVWRTYRRDFQADPGMLHVRGHEFRITAAPTQLVQADGELIGDMALDVRVEPHAALLLTPAV